MPSLSLDIPEGPANLYTFAQEPKPKQKKKYKPVAKKIRPLVTDLPARFRIQRHIRGDPLSMMPVLSPHPPPFTPTGRYTQSRRDRLHEDHAAFLWPAELDLADEFMCKHEKAFAWDDSERGRFRQDFFPPIEFPVVAHTPWVLKNIPIPPGIYKEVCAIIQEKIAAGVYEPSNSSYRSRWFCVLKKDGKSLRIVHSLEPLNAVTIQHSGVPPIPEHLAEQFAGRACGGALDLYVGYDEREIAESSRDLTTFQTPFGAHRLVTLPMGWSNSVPIFHEDVTHILQPEIPHLTVPYVDDVPVKGPRSDYRLPDGSYETIPGNSGIRRFVWEHFAGLNRIVTRMEYCGGTFSGKPGKLVLIAREFAVVGHWCTPEGRVPDRDRIEAVQNWVGCRDLSEVRAFLGTVGVARIFIKNFARRAHPLQKLTRKDVPFEFGEEQRVAMEDLKQALASSPALRAIDYDSEEPVVLAVDTSRIAVGFHLCQEAGGPPRRRYYNRFGSITLNDREARFSQPKLELYGLFRAFGALRLYLIGVRRLLVEMDASSVRGMLRNPDLAPSAAENRWIMSILLFHFELVHVPGISHLPDGLSRRNPQPGDEARPGEVEAFADWVDNLQGLLHMINAPPTLVDARRTPPPGVVVLFQQTAGTAARLPRVEPPGYSAFPRSPQAKDADAKLVLVRDWLREPLVRPAGYDDRALKGFLKFAVRFYLDENDCLWRKSEDGQHKRVLEKVLRPRALVEFHDYIGHRGLFATRAFVCDRFWWPDIKRDVAWYVKTCHECQVRQTSQPFLAPIVPVPSTPMARIHFDSMLMPNGWHFFHACCSCTTWSEGRGCRSETAKTLGDWFYQELLCRWGAFCEIVTDNGAPVVAAVEYMAEAYHIHHIRISGYNSRANGIVEGPHFHIRESLVKACGGDASKWLSRVYAVLWADRVTVRRRMGCSPYFAVTGSHPLLPFDLMEATYLSPPPTFPMTTSQLISRRAEALAGREEFVRNLRAGKFRERLQAARAFEELYANRITAYDFGRGQLVLMRNSAVEKSLNKKTRPRYLGPLVVVSRNRGGAYILAELDGAVLDRPIAARRVIPYFARSAPISLSEIGLDAPQGRIEQMEAGEGEGEDDVEDGGFAWEGAGR